MTAIERVKARIWISMAAKVPLPEYLLPASGVTALDENKQPGAILTVYLDKTSEVAVLGFCAFNPALTHRKKLECARCTMEFALIYCRQLGKKHVTTMFGSRALNRIADRIGFQQADKLVEEKYLFLT